MKSQRAIKRNLRELREFIETSDDGVATRVAYAIETAVRWATEETVEWPGLVQQAKDEAALLRKEFG
jgi:hypothetical protein